MVFECELAIRFPDILGCSICTDTKHLVRINARRRVVYFVLEVVILGLLVTEILLFLLPAHHPCCVWFECFCKGYTVVVRKSSGRALAEGECS
jgi:hypothetical protein